MLNINRFLVALISFLILAACGGGGGNSASNSTGGTSGGITWLTWVGSANGQFVLDAAGNKYQFDAANGCMYLANNAVGPANFCLTADSASATGYASYGPTNCSNPGTNTSCNTATFDVMLTNNPTGTGCIAVLGNGGANSVYANTLSVTSGAAGFSIVAFVNSTAYTDYWSTIIPICGGSSPYAGSYTVEFQNASGTTCDGGIAANDTFTIDSGGLINSDTDQVSGNITSAGTGSFATSRMPTCKVSATITGAIKNVNGLWVITATARGISFSLTQM